MPTKRQTPAADDGDALLTIARTAELYGVQTHTISAWMHRRDARLPPPIRFGRNYVRFRRRDVLERIAALADGNVTPLRRSSEASTSP